MDGYRVLFYRLKPEGIYFGLIYLTCNPLVRTCTRCFHIPVGVAGSRNGLAAGTQPHHADPADAMANAPGQVGKYGHGSHPRAGYTGGWPDDHH